MKLIFYKIFLLIIHIKKNYFFSKPTLDVCYVHFKKYLTQFIIFIKVLLFSKTKPVSDNPRARFYHVVCCLEFSVNFLFTKMLVYEIVIHNFTYFCTFIYFFRSIKNIQPYTTMQRSTLIFCCNFIS